MVDLNELDKEIDKLFENETSDSLTKWLLGKRLGSFNNIIGEGTFIGMQRQSKSIFVSKQKANFNDGNQFSPINPINRQAA